jgi:aminoglycoside phosphotransferase (APT) family kinase protein
MRPVTDFLAAHRDRLQLAGYGSTDAMRSVLLTPRFGASRHVVCLILDQHSSTPVLVAKIPRLRGDDGAIKREATVLRTLAASRVVPGSVPRVIAVDDFFGHGVLLETALAGHPVSPAFVQEAYRPVVEAVGRWLTTLVGHEGDGLPTGPSPVERLVRWPLRSLAERLEPADPEVDLLEQTLQLTSPLLAAELPNVIEHGDLSHPNVLWLGDERVGIIDWELAELRGLPLHDLSFFLAYVASAKSGANAAAERARAVREAFFDRTGWARPPMETYCVRLGIQPSLRAPLLLGCLARHAMSALSRLRDLQQAGSTDGDVMALFRDHPSYLIWRYALTHDSLGSS